MSQSKQKYNNSKVYFDPVKAVAYSDIPFRTREFRLIGDLGTVVLNRCYKFDSIHEYYCYRITLLSLPTNLQLLRQVNFLVIPKSELGSAVVYRADLVVTAKDICEKSVSYWAMQLEPVPFNFLAIEPKGILTDSARLKHLMLCAKNKITAQQILFVASNYNSLKLPSEVKSSLSSMTTALREKYELIFKGVNNGN